MYSKTLTSSALLGLLQLSQAFNTQVPSDLSGSFSQALELQAQFDGSASEGFADGTTFSKEEAATNPNFALGDASGVNTQLNFLMMMVDTTCGKSKRTLHFAQDGFVPDAVKTQLASKTSPTLNYKGPGSFGESGQRQYSFLMYIKNNANAPLQGLPQDGEAFDVEAFQKANNLQDPEGGVSFNTDLGGSTDCSGGSGGGYQSVSEPPPPYTSSPPLYSTYVPTYSTPVSTYVPPYSTYVPPYSTYVPPPPANTTTAMPPWMGNSTMPPTNGTMATSVVPPGQTTTAAGGGGGGSTTEPPSSSSTPPTGGAGMERIPSSAAMAALGGVLAWFAL